MISEPVSMGYFDSAVQSTAHNEHFKSSWPPARNSMHIDSPFHIHRIKPKPYPKTNTTLPSDLRNPPTRKSPNQKFPPLIQKQQPHTKRHRQKPMLHRNGSRSEDVVEFRDVKEENRDEERENDGRKQIPVERVLE